jgi:hypothetical protein
MTRGEFEHAIRAAGAVLGVEEVLVIGSQAVHGSLSRVEGSRTGRTLDSRGDAIRPAGARALERRTVRLLAIPNAYSRRTG